MSTTSISDIPCYNEACAKCGVSADCHHRQDHPFEKSNIAAYGFPWWQGGLAEKLHSDQCYREVLICSFSAVYPNESIFAIDDERNQILTRSDQRFGFNNRGPQAPPHNGFAFWRIGKLETLTDDQLRTVLEMTAARVRDLQAQIAELEAERKSKTKTAYELIRSNGFGRVDAPDWMLFNPGGSRTDINEQTLLSRPILCIHCGESTHISTSDLEACRETKTWDSPQFKSLGGTKS